MPSPQTTLEDAELPLKWYELRESLFCLISALASECGNIIKEMDDAKSATAVNMLETFENFIAALDEDEENRKAPKKLLRSFAEVRWHQHCFILCYINAVALEILHQSLTLSRESVIKPETLDIAKVSANDMLRRKWTSGLSSLDEMLTKTSKAWSSKQGLSGAPPTELMNLGTARTEWVKSSYRLYSNLHSKHKGFRCYLPAPIHERTLVTFMHPWNLPCTLKALTDWMTSRPIHIDTKPLQAVRELYHVNISAPYQKLISDAAASFNELDGKLKDLLISPEPDMIEVLVQGTRFLVSLSCRAMQYLRLGRDQAGFKHGEINYFSHWFPMQLIICETLQTTQARCSDLEKDRDSRLFYLFWAMYGIAGNLCMATRMQPASPFIWLRHHGTYHGETIRKQKATPSTSSGPLFSSVPWHNTFSLGSSYKKRNAGGIRTAMNSEENRSVYFRLKGILDSIYKHDRETLGHLKPKAFEFQDIVVISMGQGTESHGIIENCLSVQRILHPSEQASPPGDLSQILQFINKRLSEKQEGFGTFCIRPESHGKSATTSANPGNCELAFKQRYTKVPYPSSRSIPVQPSIGPSDLETQSLDTPDLEQNPIASVEEEQATDAALTAHRGTYIDYGSAGEGLQLFGGSKVDEEGGGDPEPEKEGSLDPFLEWFESDSNYVDNSAWWPEFVLMDTSEGIEEQFNFTDADPQPQVEPDTSVAKSAANKRLHSDSPPKSSKGKEKMTDKGKRQK